MRARYPIQRLEFNGTGKDGYQNDVESWSSPATVYVFGVNVPVTEEYEGEGHNRVTIAKVLLIPASFVAKPRDRFQLPSDPGKTYEAVGVPETAEGNPFRWNPGGRLKLWRVDG